MPRPARRHRLLAGAGVVASSLVACGSGDEPGPIVERIDDAVDDVEAYYGEPQRYLEISATPSVVSVFVAADDGVEQAFWSPDEGLVDPVQVTAVDRPTFPASAIDFDPDRILDRVREELPDSEIVDFAVTGAGSGAVVYDVRLRSEQGGVLLVLLDGDGSILGAQGE